MAETNSVKQSKGFWDILDILSKFITGFVLIVIAFLVDIGSKRIAQSNEESKIIQSLIEDLTTKQEESRNDVALLSLEKYLMSKQDEKNCTTNKAYIIDVSETLLKQRVRDDSSFSLESSIPYKIWNKYDSVSAAAFFADYYETKKGTSKIINNNSVITAMALDTIQPITQSKNATEASVISSFNKKICYIQYNNKENMAAVSNFQAALKLTNWIAPGIDYVGGNYNNTVKYFNEEDKVLAEKAAATAKKNFNAGFQLVPILNTKYKVPKGQIEVWINNK